MHKSEVWNTYFYCTVIEDLWSIKWRRFVRCRCRCWTIKDFNLYNIKSWDTKSCWCKRLENCNSWNSHHIHWYSNHRLYNIWSWIQERCYSNNSESFHRYWGRGIKCEWIKIQDFINDMYPTYKEWLTIDRIDNDWHYCKENCRWATKLEQAHNTSSNKIKWSLTQYCRDHNISYEKIRWRIRRWASFEEAILS